MVVALEGGAPIGLSTPGARPRSVRFPPIHTELVLTIPNQNNCQINILSLISVADYLIEKKMFGMGGAWWERKPAGQVLVSPGSRFASDPPAFDPYAGQNPVLATGVGIKHDRARNLEGLAYVNWSGRSFHVASNKYT